MTHFVNMLNLMSWQNSSLGGCMVASALDNFICIAQLQISSTAQEKSFTQAADLHLKNNPQVVYC